jgi:hypothetical protein
LVWPVDGLAQSRDGRLGRHMLSSGVADDAVREDVFDAAGVELALGCRMLDDVGQPHLLRCWASEAPVDEIVVRYLS